MNFQGAASSCPSVWCGDCLKGQAPQPARILPYTEKIVRSQNFKKFSKKRFFFNLWPKKYQPVLIFAREPRFWHQNSLFINLIFFSETSVIWSNFRKIVSRIQKFNFSFFSKTYIFLRNFFYSRALVTTWITCSTLQNINSSIRLAVKSLWKGLLCPNRQNNIDRKGRLECSYAKTTLLRPELLFNGRQLLWWRSKVKVNHFRETSKITKYCQRSQFFEKFWLLSVPTSLRAITLLPVVDQIAQHKNWKNFKKLRVGMTFLKSRFLTPPPPPPTCKIFSHKHIWRM